MNYQGEMLNNERGFVLVASLMVLLLLVIIGVAATTSTYVELQIAGNEKVHKQSFYQADGGTELGIRVAFENALCINSDGFTETTVGSGEAVIGKVEVKDLTFAAPSDVVVSIPNDGIRDIVYYPDTAFDTDVHTNIAVSGQTMATAGSGLQMISGYEGLGKGAAAGGTHMLYDIIAQHRGINKSESVIGIQWRLSGHLINSASSSDCNF